MDNMPDLFGPEIFLIFLLPAIFLLIFYLILSKFYEYYMSNSIYDYMQNIQLKNNAFLLIKLGFVLIFILGVIQLYNFGISIIINKFFLEEIRFLNFLIINPLNTSFFIICLVKIRNFNYQFLKGSSFYFLLILTIIIHSIMFLSRQLPNGNVLHLLLSFSLLSYLFYHVRFNLINFYEA